MQLLFQIIANGLITGVFYAIIAVGLSLVFGVLKTANQAHGEFFMLGAYIVWFLFTVNHWPFFPVVLIATLLVGLLGVLSERVLFRPVRGNMINGFLISVGLVFILQVVVGQTWGVGLSKPVAAVFPGALNLFGIFIGWQRLTILPAAILMLGGLYFFLNRSKLGLGLRACAEDRETASLYGVSANTSIVIALGVGSAMAGMAGALMSPIMSVSPYMGQVVIWTCWVVIIVGGAGNLKGTFFAALLFGLLFSIVTTLLDSTFAAIISSLFMFGFLAIRPRGLMGYAEQ